MTRNERLKAFEMRLDGHNWSEIANELGYSLNGVKHDLMNVVMSKTRQVNCAFPVIRRYIEEHCDGSIRAFSNACGLSYGSLYYRLGGRASVPEAYQKIICDLIGMPRDIVFQRDEEDY